MARSKRIGNEPVVCQTFVIEVSQRETRTANMNFADSGIFDEASVRCDKVNRRTRSACTQRNRTATVLLRVEAVDHATNGGFRRTILIEDRDAPLESIVDSAGKS